MPSMTIYACTRDESLVRLERDGRSWDLEPVLQDVAVQCVAASGDLVLAGSRGAGGWLSRDRGASWTNVELPEPDVFSVAIGPVDGALYAGTEPSRLFVSRDGARWDELEALQRIPSRGEWSFPPRPWTHHVRWIAPDPHAAERLLVGIELGGLMSTEDGGASFSDRRPGARLDTHSIAWHPSAPGRAYQAAGDGAAWSRDGGMSWEAADAGRELRYCWALAVDPADPDRWYVSAASGPGAAHAGSRARGRLYRWERERWVTLDVPGEAMPYALVASSEGLVAGMTDGRILHSEDGGDSWADAGLQIGAVLAVAAAS